MVQIEDPSLARFLEEGEGEDDGGKGEHDGSQGADDGAHHRLIEKAIPAWEKAQQQASELLGVEGIAVLDKAAKKVGMSQAHR